MVRPADEARVQAGPRGRPSSPTSRQERPRLPAPRLEEVLSTPLPALWPESSCLLCAGSSLDSPSRWSAGLSVCRRHALRLLLLWNSS